MTCDRCRDIHTAQKEGKSDKPCKCNCHDSNTLHYNGTWTTSSTGDVCNFNLSDAGGANLTTTGTFKCGCPYCQGNHD